ncbi:MAG: serine--tRNA ligase [Saprospiraceae bacterium]|jgi:seryl-tRNA synthetase|nr:serine--tRNA ligase [Saprospiraceae bacterium]MBK6476809.1 serine--tRNA ligase [Saprospiraceae bacterium]MBK6816166.1 serine--tRNA ligase [Saprospiraceae bacterium]MBK7370279.1 serine--tRNA ligase [Saprospiraceae bacterium]MBK7437987.1 serine--tRNA ligase [Saprospiraceae bacterium]
MLTLNYFNEDKLKTLNGLQKRGWSTDRLQIVEDVAILDIERKELQTQLDLLKMEVNQASKEIGILIGRGKHQEVEEIKQKISTNKSSITQLEEKSKINKDTLQDLMYKIPNIPHDSVPAGKSAEDNEVYQSWDKPMPQLYEGALCHWDLAEKYNLFDLKLGVKITGAGFPVFRGKGAKLQRALIQFFLDQASAAGYEEIVPPHLVNADSATGTGQLPDKDGQMYYCEKDQLYLIPTAEVPVTNILRDEILDVKNLPVKFCAYTPCFRREAGSYGADVKGLNRVHQFDKVEIVRVEHPDRSYDALQDMLLHVSGLLEKLDLPYRILKLCGGDMGFTSALTYDFEIFSAAQKKWLEVSSVSNFETFQSNRLKLRYKSTEGKSNLAHTLNGSALALARIVAGLLENHQTEQGILIPAALVPYTGFSIID